MAGQTARERLELAAQRRAAAQAELEQATDELRQAVRASLHEGMPETVAARITGASRTTIRAWRQG